MIAKRSSSVPAVGRWAVVGLVVVAWLLVGVSVGQVANPHPTTQADPPPKTGDSSPQDADASPPSAPMSQVNLYYLKHADAASVVDVLLTLLGDQTDKVAIVSDQRINAIIATCDPEMQTILEQIIENVDVPPQEDPTKELRMFRLQYVDPDAAAKILSIVLEPKGVRIAVDPRTGSIVVHGREELKTVEALLMQLDRKSETVSRTVDPRITFRVRIVWLVGGVSEDEGTEPAGDLKGVIDELAKVGVEGVRQVGQTIVNTLPDGHFQLECAPMLGKNPAELQISGRFLPQPALPQPVLPQSGAPELEIQISATQTASAAPSNPDEPARKLRSDRLVELETRISAPLDHYVVLAVAPVGKMTSVFVVQVTSVGP